MRYFLLFSIFITSLAWAQEKDVLEVAVPKPSSPSSSRPFGFDLTKDNAPIYVTSDTLELDTEQRVFVYKGNVELMRDDLYITADVMVGRYDQNNKMQTLACQDNVVVTRGEGLRGSADRALYKVAQDIVELTENPELFHHGNALTADIVRIFVKEDRSEADGNVRVKVVKPADSIEAAKGAGES